MLRRAGIVLLVVLALVTVAAAGGALWLRGELRASLPLLDGEARLAGLRGAAQLDRDALGVPTIRAVDRTDAIQVLGWAHGQDRFFQMDLARRRAAGELAELFGPVALDMDRRNRVHRFRRLARTVIESSEDGRSVLQAYADGVNAGLAALGARPFEYLALRTEPAPWRPEDSVLVLYSMFLELHDETGSRESRLGLIYDLLPRPLADFLAPRGDEWDSPVVGEPFASPPIPGPEVFDLRTRRRTARPRPAEAAAFLHGPAHHREDEEHLAASNNWAIAGTATADGTAIVANDMHLGINVPNIWYRASLVWHDEAGRGDHRVTGVTLPGLPAIVVGSNGHVAWGFTNSWGDWIDLVIIDVDPADPTRYLTPHGPRSFSRDFEHIPVKGRAAEPLEIVSTIWGPIVDRDHRGRLRAARWVAHDPDGVNLDFAGLDRVRTLDAALTAAQRLGIPEQNIVIGDSSGRIGWTIAGRIPRRSGFEGRVPTSWSDGARRWDGWLAPEEYPRVADPPSGRLWTANSRVVDGEMYALIGDGGYDHGARARQIRDALMVADVATPSLMLTIQLDDRALLLARWRDLLLDVLTPTAVAGDARRAAFRRLVESEWTGRASIDSVGYRLVRTFRTVLARAVLGALTAACQDADPRFNVLLSRAYETPLWSLVQARPLHLLDPRYASWQDALIGAVDASIAEITENGTRDLGGRTWGERNTSVFRHPLSRALPLAGRWLDVPAAPLPGDNDMPRVQTPTAGASERLAVAPGNEAQGLFHMPVGQSGHPFSPHYRDSHDAWTDGRATPFLPGPMAHRLTFEPAGSPR